MADRKHYNVFVVAHAIVQVEAPDADAAEAIVQKRIDEDRFPVYSLARITIQDVASAVVPDTYFYAETDEA